jgi:proteasome lid subunit RPN8/RPN11
MFSVPKLFQRAARQSGRAEAKALCRRRTQELESASDERLQQLARSIRELPDDWQARIVGDLGFIEEITKVRCALRLAQSQSSKPFAKAERARFAASSLFLQDYFQHVSSDEAGREIMHLVSAPVTLDGVHVLARIEKVALQKQSRAYVKADPLAMHRQLVVLTEDHGHIPIAWIHNHPGAGAESTQPSDIDLATQERFARMGWHAIAGIFSEDGFVRFFSTGHDFELSVFGNGADIVSAGPREAILKLVQP